MVFGWSHWGDEIVRVPLQPVLSFFPLQTTVNITVILYINSQTREGDAIVVVHDEAVGCCLVVVCVWGVSVLSHVVQWPTHHKVDEVGRSREWMSWFNDTPLLIDMIRDHKAVLLWSVDLISVVDETMTSPLCVLFVFT